MTIGEKVKEARKRKGLTQEELAKLVGYKSKTSINKIEVGDRDVPKSLLIKFADVLGVTPQYLLDWEDEPESKSQDKDKPDISYAFYGGDKGITDEMINEVQDYADMVIQRLKNQQKNALAESKSDMQDIYKALNAMSDDELEKVRDFIKFMKYQKSQE